MRVAMLCSDLGIRIPDESKGASIHLLAVAHAFARRGHDVLLVGVAGHEPPPATVETLLLPHPGRSEGLERERRKLRLVEDLVSEAAPRIAAFDADVIYERLALFGDAGQRLARLLALPHVLEVNALLAREEAAWRGLQLRSLATARERAVLDGADLCLAVSEELRAQILELVPGARVAVVPNGADTTRFARRPESGAARRALGLPANARFAAFVGALRPWHGVDLAIASLRHLGPDVRLVVAGDGPERARLEAEARAGGIADRVHWLGQRRHDEIPLVLAAANVALAPYPALDGFAFSPLKLFEYLAAGVPIVASDLGQLREVLGGGELGRLVPPGDARALADGILESFGDHARDRARRARAHALRAHSWDARAETIESEIACAMKSKERRVAAG